MVLVHSFVGPAGESAVRLRALELKLIGVQHPVDLTGERWHFRGVASPQGPGLTERLSAQNRRESKKQKQSG